MRWKIDFYNIYEPFKSGTILSWTTNADDTSKQKNDNFILAGPVELLLRLDTTLRSIISRLNINTYMH